MIRKPDYQLLGDKITELIQAGITLNDGLIHYIDSTFATPTISEFQKIITDPDSCETETVFELLFFPDEQFQRQIEPILGKHPYDDEGIENIIWFLKQKKIQTCVIFPDHRGELQICLPDSTIRSFISRLNITRHIEPRILKSLEQSVSKISDVHQIRVMLRNARITFSDPVCTFLCNGIEKMYSRSAYFQEAFVFMLDFLEENNSILDIYSRLIRKKQAGLQMIQMADRNEKILKTNTVEALMLKGVHIPPIQISDIRKQITLIDHICISIYGKTDFI
jgi:hypothetical protein